MKQNSHQLQDMLWFDTHLPKEAMNHLWHMIDMQGAQPCPSLKNEIQFGGPNNKIYEIEDKNDWFFNNILKDSSEYFYYANWNNYHDVIVTKRTPRPVFVLDTVWVNHQKQTEFIPPHVHEAFYSFVVFMKIPTHWKEQQAVSWLKNVEGSCVSDFQFLFGNERGHVRTIPIPLGPKDEGRMLFFPSWLMHQVFPFYDTEEERITISGNILIDKHNSEK